MPAPTTSVVEFGAWPQVKFPGWPQSKQAGRCQLPVQHLASLGRLQNSVEKGRDTAGPTWHRPCLPSPQNVDMLNFYGYVHFALHLSCLTIICCCIHVVMLQGPDGVPDAISRTGSAVSQRSVAESMVSSASKTSHGSKRL